MFCFSVLLFKASSFSFVSSRFDFFFLFLGDFPFSPPLPTGQALLPILNLAFSTSSEMLLAIEVALMAEEVVGTVVVQLPPLLNSFILDEGISETKVKTLVYNEFAHLAVALAKLIEQVDKLYWGDIEWNTKYILKAKRIPKM